MDARCPSSSSLFERIGGIWFGLGLIVVWSIVCLLLVPFASDAMLVAVVVALWLVVVIPTAWGVGRSRFG